MAIGSEHPLHGRRKRSNLMLGAVLGSFVALVFAITIVKMTNGASMEAFDHTVRYSIEPTTEAGQ
nr:cytochrome C oxidase assembly protein [Amylibacter sp.]